MNHSAVTPDPRCSSPVVHLTGRATARATAIVESIEISQADGLLISAHAEALAPGAPDSDSAAQVFDRPQQVLAKPKDCVILNVRYEIDYAVEGGCEPSQVSMVTSGEIVSTHRCLKRRGRVVLSRSKIFEASEMAVRERESLIAAVTVRDCTGESSVCTIEIPEP